ncbi:hypothetical protein [Hymenobacter yonginensis]|uniref:Uncharacterized protein n=1 Tax=Hymenobacter yonginensis TaxID=748197 RepID=A0ABY7PQY2_9BACT|nr:hypothetical protein [Hymenobacter yonginensis]WBO85058.1 hypothetical protein O9Z63_02190 [Hymenobacter yonginensis]
MEKDAVIRHSRRQRTSRRSSRPRIRRETLLASALLALLVGFVLYHAWRYGW